MERNRILSPSEYWNRCQLFKPMQMRFGVAANRTVSFGESLAFYRNFGADITISASRSIQITEGDAIVAIFGYLSVKVKEMISAGEFSPLTFDNFLPISEEKNNKSLEKGIWGKNGQALFLCLWEFLCSGNNAHIRSILCPVTDHRQAYTSWYEKCKTKTYQALAKNAKLFQKDGSKGAYNVAKQWSYCLLPLQMAVTDYRILDLVPRLFEMPAPDVEQRTSIAAEGSYFSSPEWYKTWVYSIIDVVERMVTSDLGIEDKLVKLARSRNIKLSESERKKYLEGSDTRSAFDFEDWDEIIKCTQGIGSGLKLFDYKLYNLLDANRQLYNNCGMTSEVMNRIKALIVAGVLTDMIQTLLKYGPNPKMGFDRNPESEAAKGNLVKQYLE